MADQEARGKLVVGDDEQEVTQKIFACKHCDKKFSNPQVLGGHQNAHRGQRKAESRAQQEDHLSLVQPTLKPYHRQSELFPIQPQPPQPKIPSFIPVSHQHHPLSDYSPAFNFQSNISPKTYGASRSMLHPTRYQPYIVRPYQHYNTIRQNQNLGFDPRFSFGSSSRSLNGIGYDATGDGLHWRLMNMKRNNGLSNGSFVWPSNEIQDRSITGPYSSLNVNTNSHLSNRDDEVSVQTMNQNVRPRDGEGVENREEDEIDLTLRL